MPEKKKTILYIITQAEWGGAQRYIFDLGGRFKDEYHVVVAVGEPTGKRDLLTRFNSEQIQTVQLRRLVRRISPIDDILAVCELAKLYKTVKPDIIHLNSSKAGVIGSLARLLVKGQMLTVYTAHGWTYLEPLPFYQRWLYLLMEKISVHLRDATIVLSEKEKNIALQYGTAKKDSVYVIPNGIDLNKIKLLSREEARKKLDIKDIGYLTIGVIANLYKTKGLKHLIEAINILKNKYSISNIKTIITGEGHERKNLETQVKKLNLENNIYLVGAKDNAYQYLKAFDLFVLPSVKEGFPYVILEAMAAGLPIVATKVGALPEIINEKENGPLVPPADPEALAQAINNLLADSELREKIKQNNPETVKKYSLEKTIAQIKNIYK
jgi:glycosyltransferase involved in cell wall biosynthesis